MFLVVFCLINICFFSSEAKQNSGSISIENFEDLYLKVPNKESIPIRDITKLEIGFGYDKTTEINISLCKGSIELSKCKNCTLTIYLNSGKIIKNIDSELGEKVSFEFEEDAYFCLKIKLNGEKLDCLIKPENKSDEFGIRSSEDKAQLRNFGFAQRLKFEILENASTKFYKLGETSSYMMAILYDSDEIFFELVPSYMDLDEYEESKYYLVPLTSNYDSAIKFFIENFSVNINIWLGSLEADTSSNKILTELSNKIDQCLKTSN